MIEDIDIILEVLNQAVKNDPTTLYWIVETRFKANEKLINSPVVVNEKDEVGALGIINAIVERLTGLRVAAVYSESGNALLGFKKYDPETGKCI